MSFGWPSFIDVQFPLSRNETFCGLGHFQKRGNGGVFGGQMVPFVGLLGDNDSGVMLCGGEGVRSSGTDRGIAGLGRGETACCQSPCRKVQHDYMAEAQRDHQFLTTLRTVLFLAWHKQTSSPQGLKFE